MSDIPVTAPTAPAAAPETAPSSTPTPETPATPGKRTAPTTARAKALAKLTGSGDFGTPAATETPKLGGVVAEPAAVEAPPEPAAAPESAVEAKPEPVATDLKAEVRLAKAMGDIRERDKKLLEQSNQSKELAAKLDALSAELAAIKADPVRALKAAGTTFDEFTQRVLKGELKPPTPDEVAREQVSEKLTPMEAKLKELEDKLAAKEAAEAEAAQRAQAEAVRASDLGIVKAQITAEKYPLLSALPNGHELVLSKCYEDGVADPHAKAVELERNLEANLAPFISNPQVLARLGKASPKIRETVLAAFGGAGKAEPKTSSAGPRALAPDMVSAPTTPVDRPKSYKERRAKALSIISEALKGS